MTSQIFPVQTRLFPSVGLNRKRGRRHVTKLHGFHFQWVSEAVLVDRISLIILFDLFCRLALMEFKMTLATFVWHFDARLKEGQYEPRYEDAFVVMRGPLEIIVSPVN